jgi:hypothetical protein
LPRIVSIIFSVLTNGDSLPFFVSPELGEGETARHLQGVLVLRRKGDAAQRGEQRHNLASIANGGRSVMSEREKSRLEWL